MMAHVVVGAGQAGGWAARTLRDEGYDGPLLLIGAESHAPYERPPLSKAALTEEIMPDSAEIIGREELTHQRIEFLSQTEVAAIQPAKQMLHLANARPIAYERLILCTGGRARLLPVTNDMPTDRIHHLRTPEDAQRLRDALHLGGRLGIVGGGWVGLEAAASARKLGCQVEVLEGAARLCARSVPPWVSERLLQMHRANGVAVRLSCGPLSAVSAPNECVAMEVDGERLEFDHLLCAVGMVPNDELARAAGLCCKDGIVVDSACRTSDAAIYAAGDACVLDSRRAGALVRFESWQNAQDQGIAAARSALGIEVNYDPVPRVWSEQYDQTLRIAGHFRAQDEIVCHANDAGFVCASIDDGKRLTGLVTSNRMRDHRLLLKSLVAGLAVDVERFQLAPTVGRAVPT